MISAVSTVRFVLDAYIGEMNDLNLVLWHWLGNFK
jgi:hypothetical protein